jgi:WD40 repeat protein
LDRSKATRTLEGHTDVIRSVAFLPDGKRLATGSDDYTTKIWNLNCGIAERTLKEAPFVIVSPDGKRLATGSWGKSVKVRDIDSNKVIYTLEGHTSSVWSIAFSPDSKWLATESDDSTVKIWDLDSSKVIYTLEGYTEAVTSVAFSPACPDEPARGKWLATGSDDNTAKIWNLNSGKVVYNLAHHSSVTSVTFSHDGKWLATGSDDSKVRIWDLDSGKIAYTLEGHAPSVTSVAFSPDGKRVASGSEDYTAKIWEIQPDTLIKHWQREKQAGLILSQLQKYNLAALLTLQPGNDTKLIATGEVWQIKAFADLAASQASGSNILARVESHYTLAERLYTAALALQDERLIREDYASMLSRWAEVCKSDGLESKAAELEAKVDGLWKWKD